MHFEVLVEDKSGKKALEILLPKIIVDPHTWKVYAYKGIGRIPKGLKPTQDPRKRILLDQLPKLLRGYGEKHVNYPDNYPAAVIVISDLDDKCLKEFREELYQVLERCLIKPETRFCIAVEEGEAWFLGDISAIKTAYSNAKDEVLKSYKNDSICGTWEKLADAIYPGGSDKLFNEGWQAVGRAKSEWAANIAPHMNVDDNNSPSFCYFCKKLRELAGIH